MGADTGTSVSVIEAIADREGVDPVELRPTLNDVIDPDALDALFQENGEGGGDVEPRVRFTYCGYTVTATGSGRVDVDDPVDPEVVGESPDGRAVD